MAGGFDCSELLLEQGGWVAWGLSAGTEQEERQGSASCLVWDSNFAPQIQGTSLFLLLSQKHLCSRGQHPGTGIAATCMALRNKYPLDKFEM